MDYKTNRSLGTIHQQGQNRCKQLGNNNPMVTPLILLDIGVNKLAEKPAEYTRVFYKKGRKHLCSLII